ncbi:MAG: RIP metalloprotease RseP [Mariprofundaceae bacterium]|nr:RIP metalloprotease RseP [Mariprofundaceae bacterium]
MLETLHTTLAFIVAIALLIAVHEYGHFIVARKLGIKVEKFSIGFGPALISWWSRDGEVQYVIAAIPFGGYVKMLGEGLSEQEGDATEQLSDEERLRAFDVQPPWKRASVAVAGPLFNFFFAILAYMLIGWIGQAAMPPVIGSIAPASVAEQSGMLEGDIIRTLNGSPVHSWEQVEEKMKQLAGNSAVMEVDRNGTMIPMRFNLPATEQDVLLVNVSEVSLGIFPGVKVVADSVAADSAAGQGGILPGDYILQAQGTPVTNIRELIEIIRSRAGETVSLQVRRNETVLNLTVIPTADESGYGRIGVRLAASPMHEPVIYRMGVVEGFFFGFERTWEMTTMTIQVLGKMVTSAISPENLGGPIAIAQLAGKTAELGIIAFMSFLALISVNLAVLNLLPIPVLDGGHLAYIALEKVRGKPLSPTTMERTQIIGISLIVVLMLFAFYNDLLRLFRG